MTFIPLIIFVLFTSLRKLETLINCTSGKKFMIKPLGPVYGEFLYICRKEMTSTYGELINCLNPKGEDIPIGGTLDVESKEQDEMGFRLECEKNEDTGVRLKLTHCVFAMRKEFKAAVVLNKGVKIAGWNAECYCRINEGYLEKMGCKQLQ